MCTFEFGKGKSRLRSVLVFGIVGITGSGCISFLLTQIREGSKFIHILERNRTRLQMEILSNPNIIFQTPLTNTQLKSNALQCMVTINTDAVVWEGVGNHKSKPCKKAPQFCDKTQFVLNFVAKLNLCTILWRRILKHLNYPCLHCLPTNHCDFHVNIFVVAKTQTCKK